MSEIPERLKEAMSRAAKYEFNSERSPTLKEAMRRASDDERNLRIGAETFVTAEKTHVEHRAQVNFYCNEREYNALIELLNTQIGALTKLESTARTGFRSESIVKNHKRADKYRDKAETLGSILKSIQDDNYDKF